MKHLRIVLIVGLCAVVGGQSVCVLAESRSDDVAAAPGSAASAAAPPNDAASGASSRIVDATVAPLGDLNLVRSQIPEILVEAQKAPYFWPVDASCDKLAEQIIKLNLVLGPDLDVQRAGDSSTWASKGGNAVGDAAVGALQGFTEGIIPFRGWVRKLTGAEQHARDVVSAIAAGTIRRAYLKGIGQARDCVAPAAPLRNALEMPRAASAPADGAESSSKVVPSKK